jgi:poly(hydroxyalkanoate) depolymerase family esterase
MRTAFKAASSVAKTRAKLPATLQMPSWSVPAPPVANASPGEVADFGSNPGKLSMFVHHPLRAPDVGAPLIVLLHGCGQTAAAFARDTGWGKLADQLGVPLVLPEQSGDNNRGRCFNWFRSAHVNRDLGEALSIRQMVTAAVDQFGSDPARVFVAGLSAGGAMAAALMAAYPDVFAAGAIIAGLPFGVATTLRDAPYEMHHSTARPPEELGDLVRRASKHTGPWPRLSVWHGSSDRTVNPANADELVKQWLDLHQLPPAPMSEGTVDGYPREVWWNGDGETVVESYTITDMAHGTPLGVADNDQRYGSEGVYLIEAGISSSFHIAKFFGLTSWIRERKPKPPESPSAKLIPPVTPTLTATPMQNLAKMIWPAKGIEQAAEEPAVQAPEPMPPPQQIAPRRRAIDMTAAINRVLVAAGLRKAAGE